MPEVSRTFFSPKDVTVEISEIRDGIYRIARFVKDYGINQRRATYSHSYWTYWDV